jgi:hypothetical protein
MDYGKRASTQIAILQEKSENDRFPLPDAA